MMGRKVSLNAVGKVAIVKMGEGNWEVSDDKKSLVVTQGNKVVNFDGDSCMIV